MRASERNPENYDPRESYAAKQLSRYDMEVAGLVVYVVTLMMFFVVALVMMLFRNEPASQARTHEAKPVVAAASAPRPTGLARTEESSVLAQHPRRTLIPK